MHLLVSELYRFQNARSNDKNCTNMSIALGLGIFISGAGFIKICIGNLLLVNMKDKRNTIFLFYFEFSLFRKAFAHLDRVKNASLCQSELFILSSVRNPFDFKAIHNNLSPLHCEVRRVRTFLRIFVCRSALQIPVPQPNVTCGTQP